MVCIGVQAAAINDVDTVLDLLEQNTNSLVQASVQVTVADAVLDAGSRAEADLFASLRDEFAVSLDISRNGIRVKRSGGGRRQLQTSIILDL
eukprot:COSAG03_NODE_67_length_15062_cov_86.408781_7_plen_92_part_00